jgi:hypothetical protein
VVSATHLSPWGGRTTPWAPQATLNPTRLGGMAKGGHSHPNLFILFLGAIWEDWLVKSHVRFTDGLNCKFLKLYEDMLQIFKS